MDRVVIHDDRRKCWLRFDDPVDIVTAENISEVGECLRRIEERTQCGYVYAAGFLAYEAAAGLDSSLHVSRYGPVPLLWFGLYEGFERCESIGIEEASADMNIEWRSSISEDRFKRAIKHIRSYISAGETYQVNFSYRLRAKLNVEASSLFHSMVQAQQASFCAFIETDEWAVCSASPELFFSLNGERIVSRPMKGTASRGLTNAEDRSRGAWLQGSGKNRAENIMITDMVRSDLGRIARTGSIRTEELCSIEKYPTLWQMTSSVAAETDATLPELFESLFPPASITGAPKCRTMEIIAELEDSPRGIYTGSIGFVEPNRRAQFNVAIRTAWIDKLKGQAEYGVGGGIVWDSRDRSEREETLVKSRILDACIPQFDLIETLLWTAGEGYHLLDRHIARLTESAEYFSFQFDEFAAREALNLFAASLPDLPHKVRFLLSKRGQMRIEESRFDTVSETTPKVILARKPVDSGNPFLYHKTSNRRIYEEHMDASSDDVILWNERGEITESTISNIFLDIDGELATPPISSGLLAGTMRAEMLEKGECKECKLDIEELERCNAIYLANSVRGMYRVELAIPGPLASPHICS